MKLRGWLAAIPCLFVACSSAESTSEGPPQDTGGTNGGGQGGTLGGAGKSGSSGQGGKAGAPSGGQAGSVSAGSGGQPSGGSPSGGQAGQAGSGASAGNNPGGANAGGASAGGEAGANAGGETGQGGTGEAGASAGGQGGTPSGGQAGQGGQASGADPVKRLQVVVKVGNKVGDGTDNPVKFCVNSDAAKGCFKLDNEWSGSGQKHNDFVRGVRDHFDLSPDGLTHDDLKFVSLDAGTGDDLKLDCVAVVADGDLVYCKDELNVTIGTSTKPSWKDATLATSCGSCYRGGARLTHGPMVGHTTKTTSKIWLRAGSSVPVQIRYGTSATLDNAKLSATVTPKPSDDFTLTVPLEGLTAGKTYFYTPVVNGKDSLTSDFPSFSTAPDGPAEFTVAFGSCSNFEAIKGNPVTLEEFPTAYPVYDEIRKFTTKPSATPTGPDLLLFIGDNHYGNTWSARGHAFFYRESRDQPQFARVLKNVPTLATWDDHDFGTNNSAGADHKDLRDGALTGFNNYWANGPEGLVPGKNPVPGIWSQASWGGVDFFLIDDRYYRAAAKVGQTSAPMLGPDQLAWLVDALDKSTAKFKLIASGSMWSSHLDPSPGEDTWASHPDELDALLKAIDSKKINGVVLMSGDKHRSAVYRHRAATATKPAIFELMSSGLSGAENNCTNGGDELLCVAFKGPTYGRLRFTMNQADPTLLYQIGGPEFGVWAKSFTLKASQLKYN